MKEINKLVGLVTHGLKSNFGVIDLTGEVENPGKEQQLYNGVLNGEYVDDEVTAKGMYNSNIYDQRFRMLKSRLRYKLYDLLYHLDFEVPKYSYLMQKRLECKEYIHKAHILYEMGELGMAEKQYNKVIVLAGECQLTNELIQANEIKRNVLAREFKPTDFELTLEELVKLRAIKQKEDVAEDLFVKVQLLLSKSIHSRNINVPTAAAAVDDLEQLYKETGSFNIFMNLYEMKIWMFNLEQRFDDLVNFLNSVPKELKKLPINPECFELSRHHLYLGKAYLIQEKFEEGLAGIKTGFKNLDKSTDLWFELSEVHFMLAIRAWDLKQAYSVFQTVTKNPNFNRAPESVFNRWKIFKLYLNFAYPEKGLQKRIRFYDIYDSAEDYFQESKGYMLSLYMLDFIHQLNKESLELAEKRLDDLEAFFYKHLNDPGKNQREKQLIKMIKVLRTSGYDLEDTKIKIETYAQRLTEKKVINPFGDQEIIPYEKLWEMVTEAIERKAHLVS